MKTKLQEGWKEIRLEEIAKVDSGQGAPQGEKWFTGNKIFVRAGDLNKLSEGVFVGDYCEKITDDAVEKYSLTLYPKNSVVFPKSGMSIATENIAILKYDSYVVNHLAIIENEDLIDSKYIFYFLKKLKILNLIRNSSYPSIRISDIKNLKILWPSKEVRREIVTTLEKAEQLKQLRDEADKLTMEFLKAVFSEMFGDLYKNKNNFETKRLDEIKKEGTYISYGIVQAGPDVDDGIPYIKTGDIQNGVIRTDKLSKTSKKIAEKYKRSQVHHGDLVYSIRATVGTVALLPESLDGANLTQGTAKISPGPSINKHYLLWYLRSNGCQTWIKSRMKGVTFKEITLETLRETPVLVPPIELQNKFASIVEEIKKLQEYQKQSKENIENLFNNLIQKAFRGELVC